MRLPRRALSLAVATALLTLAQASSHAQPTQLPPPDATDPVALKLMQGFPPPPDKQVRLGTILKYPNARWALHHLRELGPTANIARGPGPVSELQATPRELDGLAFLDDKGARTTLAQWQKATYTDGLLVMHQGRVVYERHYVGNQPHVPHVLWSMSKSLTGLLATELIHEGLIDPAAPVTRYLPELANSAWADATVQQTLDMTTGVKYAEDFADPQSGVFQYLISAGLVPAPANYPGARAMLDYLPTVQKEGEHGKGFYYKSVDTEVIGWILQRVTGKSFATLLSERIWAPLGAEQDGYVWADPTGAQSTSVGINATLRDLGRLGEMLRQNGYYNHKQVISPATVTELRKGASPEHFKASGQTMRAGYSYHNHWWLPHDVDGSFEAKGLMGQHIHVNPTAQLVVVKLSSHPIPNTAFTHNYDRLAFAAIAGALR